MSDNWVVGNLQYALSVWNEKLNEIWTLITQTPENFKGGSIWNIVVNINGAIQAIGLALLVLFFLFGIVKTCSSFAEVKKPEQVLKLFIRFILTKTAVTYGLELMLAVFKITQGIMQTIMESVGIGGLTQSTLPSEMIVAIESCNFFECIPLWAVTLIRRTVSNGFIICNDILCLWKIFKIFFYTALAPIPLSTFAGEPSQQIGRSFIKSFCAVCLEGAIIILACIIFTQFASSPPVIDTNAQAVNQVWSYIGELVFNMLVLVGTVKMSDRVVREMLGL